MTSQTPKGNFSITYLSDSFIIHLPERLSVLEAIDFKNVYYGLLQENASLDRIFLDFRDTRFIDSSGVGALVHNFKASNAKRVELILQNVNPAVMTVLSITGLDEVLSIDSNSLDNEHFIQNSYDRVPRTHPSVRSKLKRTLDIIGALVGLTITAILLVPIAIAIKSESPGPIFYRQIRCGWLGKRFKIWKFRSMCNNAEVMKSSIPNQANGAFFKNDNDPRVTKIGRFLRSTSLDELPQFWNVLKGEMSLVGTRPPTPDEVERYQIPQWQRLDVKPGMTGEWQVNGRSRVRNFEDVIKLDLRYQENWSHQYDVKLILKTILVVFSDRHGAV
jgi:anti-anti-sigma factor